MNRQLLHLPVDVLQRGKYQPRQMFEEENLNELGQSILQQGLIEPIIVRKISSSQYEIIAGERRWRAAMKVGLTNVPCILGTYTDEQAAAITLIENIQRQDLNLIEEAQGYQRLIQSFHYHQEELSQLIGKSRSHIANLLRLLTLTENVQELIKNRHLALGHARMLVGLPESLQVKISQCIVKNNWSVRRVEEEIKKLKSLKLAAEGHDVLHLENQIAEQLNTPVEILSEMSGGWLKIKFFDNDTLGGILERIGIKIDAKELV